MAGRFEFVADAAIVRRAGDAVVIEHLERREQLANGANLRVIVAAGVGAEFQFRRGNGR